MQLILDSFQTGRIAIKKNIIPGLKFCLPVSGSVVRFATLRIRLRLSVLAFASPVRKNQLMQDSNFLKYMRNL